MMLKEIVIHQNIENLVRNANNFTIDRFKRYKSSVAEILFEDN